MTLYDQGLQTWLHCENLHSIHTTQTQMSTMERFKRFSEMFANFPTLQKDLSLLDKPANEPAANGRRLHSTINESQANDI
jgi:hypothetical protein